jgi:hypothetical protein
MTEVLDEALVVAAIGEIEAAGMSYERRAAGNEVVQGLSMRLDIPSHPLSGYVYHGATGCGLD